MNGDGDECCESLIPPEDPRVTSEGAPNSEHSQLPGCWRGDASRTREPTRIPATHLAALDAVVCVQARGVVEAKVQGRLGAGHQRAAIQADGALQEGRLHGGGGLLVAVAVG